MTFQSSQGCKRFFKIILQNALAHQKLMIPIKFVRNHGDELQDQAAVLLKVPNGKTWEVELRKCSTDGKVWLENGWKEFADYYSIAHGHFLVFEYIGNSVFTVLIFDRTATEIDYDSSMSSRRTSTNNDQIITIEDSDDDDKSVEILDDFSSFNKKRERSSFPSSCPRPPPSPPRRIAKTDSATKTSGRVNLSAMIEKANAFKSENPFFWVIIQPSYVKNGSNLAIPHKFAKEYFKGIRGQVILRLSESCTETRSWTVKYGINVTFGNARFCSGWVPFMKDNHLQVGDVCIFELIKGIEISLQVLILRSHEEVADRTSSIRQSERGKSLVGKFEKGSSSSKCS